jgi:hypothetical protein
MMSRMVMHRFMMPPMMVMMPVTRMDRMTTLRHRKPGHGKENKPGQ